MLKKFTGVLLSAALIVSAVGSLTALPTTAASGSFTPQHMEVDFSNYVLSSVNGASSVLSTGEAGMNAKRVSWYKENDDTNSWLKFTSKSSISGVTKSQDPNLYSLLVNPTGKAGRSNGTSPTILDSDPIYKIENGVRYRVSFKYKLDLVNSPANDNLEVCVLLGAAATGTMGYKNPGESSKFDLVNNRFKFGLNNQYNMVSPVSGKYALTASKDVWKEVSVDFVAEQSNDKLWSKMVDSMILGFVPLKGSVISTSALYDLYIDDIVVDRVASANIVNDDGTNETVYGAPACTEEYRDGFGTCEAEKIALPASRETYGGYADGIYTASADVPAFYFDEARENAVADPVFKAETQTLYYGNAYSTDTVKNQVAFCGFDEHNLRKSFDISGTSTASKNWNSFVKCGYRNKKWSISSAEAFTGTKSVYINTTEWDSDTTQRSRNLYVGNGYELEPGKTYNISLWVKRDTSKTQTADLNIGFVNAGDFNSPNWLKGAKILNADFTGDWQQVVIENVKIPETQPKDNYALPYEYYMAPVLQIVSNNAFWLDTVVISEIITPGDINKDAKVNICDLVALNNAITDNETDVSYMDLNNDAAVDDKDLAELRSILLSK